MFFARFAILLFLVAFGFAMGRHAQLNAIGTVIALQTFISVPALYLLPTYEAARCKHPNISAVFLINLLLGWTLIGWVVAAVWALKRPEPVRLEPAAGVPPPQPAAPADLRNCPMCAEPIRRQALKCKHCGSLITAAG